MSWQVKLQESIENFETSFSMKIFGFYVAAQPWDTFGSTHSVDYHLSTGFANAKPFFSSITSALALANVEVESFQAG